MLIFPFLLSITSERNLFVVVSFFFAKSEILTLEPVRDSSFLIICTIYVFFDSFKSVCKVLIFPFLLSITSERNLFVVASFFLGNMDFLTRGSNEDSSFLIILGKLYILRCCPNGTINLVFLGQRVNIPFLVIDTIK